MKTLSRYIMTLALLLTAVTGAWAQAPKTYFQQDYSTETVDWTTGTGGRYTPIIENGYLTVNQNQRSNNGTTLTCTATQGKVDAGKDFTMTFNVKLGASNNRADTEFNIYDASNSGLILSLAEGSVNATAWKINGGTQTATVSAGGGKSLDELSWIFVQVTSIAGGKTYLTLKDEQNNIIDGFDKTEIPTISVAGGLGKMEFITSRYHANFAIDNVLVRDVVDDQQPEVPLEFTWNAATKTGTFTMPAYDVEIAPIYAPTAQWAKVENVDQLPTAIEGIYAESTDAIVKAGTVAKIGETENLQGTLMYAVSTSATEQPALTAFSATLPTAEKIAAGDVYVWYYIKGADAPQGQTATAENTFNDSEICTTPLKVTVLNNKFDIQFNAANANTIEAGKATVTVGGTAATVTEGKLEGVKMGSEVKLEAKPGYKFRKVEVKKAATTSSQLSAVTTDDIGKVVCAAGHLHDAKTAVPDGCTAVGILGKVTETGHGLILALQNATSKNWNTINSWTSASYAGTTLKVLPDDGARSTNLSSYETLGETAVSNWAVAQKSDYEAIFTNLGSATGDSDGMTYDGNVNAYITTGVGGAALDGRYWSATEDSGYGCDFNSSFWNLDGKSNSYNVRPVLGF